MARYTSKQTRFTRQRRKHTQHATLFGKTLSEKSTPPNVPRVESVSLSIPRIRQSRRPTASDPNGTTAFRAPHSCRKQQNSRVRSKGLTHLSCHFKNTQQARHFKSDHLHTTPRTRRSIKCNTHKTQKREAIVMYGH